jgi:hypothetical protein
LFFENLDECTRRIKDSTGLDANQLHSFENVDQAEIDKKLLKNMSKNSVIKQSKDQIIQSK